MPTAVQALRAEPRAPQCPRRLTRDYVLSGALVLAAVLEGILRTDAHWPVVATAVAVALACAMLWRRTHPLAVTAVVTSAVVAMVVASLVAGLEESAGLYTQVFILLVPYSLFRWASGREIVSGTALLLGMFAVAMSVDYTTFGEAVGGFVFFWFPAALGASVRLWTTSRLRDVERARIEERAQLARELHDTVAHHVSAMVVRAQAGLAVAAVQPEAALETLELIEQEGARTLTEMRAMVRALREPGQAELAPQAGVGDIARLARATDGEPTVAVSITGPAESVAPTLGVALYRIAQESITNALRHARGVGRVDVAVEVAERCVRLRVVDDGQSVAGAARSGPVTAGSGTGYGIAGMTERATLLGGWLTAGPRTAGQGGWLVEAELPRGGSTS